MVKEDIKPKETSLLKTLGSLQFGIVLLIVVACVSIVGTILPQGKPPAFYQENFSGPVSTLIQMFRFDVTYRSPLFVGLLCLFGLNLILCSIVKFPSILKRAFSPDKTPGESRISKMPVNATVKNTSIDSIAEHFTSAGFRLNSIDSKNYFGEKGRLGYLGAFTVHVSLLLLLAGSVVSLVTGVRGYVLIYEGETASVANITETETMPLGFSVTLNNFDVTFYEDFPGRPKDYLSMVTVTLPDGSSYDKDVRVNHPIMLNNFTLFQSSYGQEEAASQMHSTAENDTALVAIRLKGAPESMPSIVELSMALGDSYIVPGMGDSISVRLSELHRSFKQGATMGGTMNPAIKVEILVYDSSRWSIFAFKNFPGMNMPMHDDLPLAFEMKDILMTIDDIDSHEGHNHAAQQRYYSVLGVVRDKGIPFMWAGSIFMTIGLVLAFYLRPRRLWAVEIDGNVIIGGTAKGSSEAHKEYVKKTIADFRKKQ